MKTSDQKVKVLVLFGGCSSEYSVSLSSAAGVLSHLDSGRYEPVMVGITREGHWYHYTGSVEKIAADAWVDKACCADCALSPNRGERCLLVLHTDGIERIPISVALPILHGKNGEDGTVQGMIELAGIPLAGCGTLASALCMDKDRAHKLASLAGVYAPRSLVLRSDDISVTNTSCREAADFAASVGYPLFVKPVRAGSSYGITKVLRPDELMPAISLALQYDSSVILEENIEGFEVGCAVLGTTTLLTGEPDEVELSNGFFDYTEKYTLKTSAIHVPARVDAALAEQIKTTAKCLYRALDCSGFARVDMFVTPDKKIVFNEVNTIPGFTEHSRYPGMMNAAGYSLDELLTLILENALAVASRQTTEPVADNTVQS